MTLIFTQQDLDKVSLEEYERVIALELPEGRKPVEEIANKLKAIKQKLDNDARKVELEKASIEAEKKAKIKEAEAKKNNKTNWIGNSKNNPTGNSVQKFKTFTKGYTK